MIRPYSPRLIRTLLKIVLVCIIVAVIVVIFFPESQFSKIARKNFEKVWPEKWRTVHDESRGNIIVFFGPCRKDDTSGIDDELIRLINSAEEEIKAAIYDLKLENITGAFLNANNKGVNVSVVFDESNISRYSKKLKSAKIGIMHRPEGKGYMHNKFVVVDGERVWTGSMNFTPNGAYRNNNNGLIIESNKIAANYIAEFDEMYDGYFGPVSPENTANPTVFLNGIEVETYFAPEDGVEQEILSELRKAEKEIVFMAFSFTSVPIAELMSAKIKEGVVVRGVFEKRQRSYSRFEYLQKTGGDVRWDSNRYSMHHKVIVVDGEVVITGSYNFSKGANTRNDENCLIIHSKDIAEKFLEEFDRVYQ